MTETTTVARRKVKPRAMVGLEVRMHDLAGQPLGAEPFKPSPPRVLLLGGHDE